MESAAMIFYDKDKRILLQLRDDKPEIKHPGMYGPFGGTIEPGEDKKQAILREVFEEIGIRMNEKNIRYLGHFEITPGDNSNYFTTEFIGDIDDIQLNEGSGIRFFTKQEIDKEPKVIGRFKEILDEVWDKI